MSSIPILNNKRAFDSPVTEDLEPKRQKTAKMVATLKPFEPMETRQNSPPHELAFSDAIKENDARDIQLMALLEAAEFLHKTVSDYPWAHELVQQKIEECFKSNLSFEEQMAEFGMLHYFLLRESSIPETKETLTNYRVRELEKEVLKLKEVHHQLDKNLRKEIPSGITDYLLFMFAEVLIGADQRFNLGGIYAVRLFLENEKSYLSSYFKEEYKERILTILGAFIKDRRLKALFEKETTIHPDLAYLIRLDLKLREDASISSHLIMQDCLMALFFDIRQSLRGDCFTIAPLSYATANEPYLFMTEMLEHLKNGYLECQSCQIPIKYLLDNTPTDESDLLHKIDESKTLSLTSIKAVQKVLKLKSFKARDKKEFLYDTLADLTTENKQDEKLELAIKIYRSFSYNNLIEMMTLILNFKNKIQTTKDVFCENLIKELKKEHPGQLDAFFGRLESELKNKLWLIYETESEAKKKDKNLELGPYQNRWEIQNFSGDLDALKNVFQNSAYILHYIDSSNQYPLFHLKDFQKTVSTLSEKVSNELFVKGYDFKEEAVSLGKSINSDKFCHLVAEIIAQQIDVSGIDGKDLYSADLLILKHTGGKASLAIDHLKMTFQRKKITPASPEDLLDDLRKFYKKIDLKNRDLKNFIVRAVGHHTFILTASKHLEINDSKKELKKIKKNLSSNAPNLFLSRIFTKEVLDEILDDCFDQKEKKEIEKKLIKKHAETYQELQKIVLKAYPNDVDVKKGIDTAFNKVTLNAEDIESVVKRLCKTIPLEKAHAIHKVLVTKLKGRFPPHVFARKLKKLFIKNEIGNLPVHTIERAICEHFQMPVPLIIGDLNWRRLPAESPHHNYMVIRYDFGLNTLAYFNRDKLLEKRYDDNYFKNMTIFYPDT